MRLKRTKCSKLLTEVLAPSFKEELINDISSNYFSLLIDESTDVGTLKFLALVVRYYSTAKKTVCTTFYRMIQLEKCDSTSIAENIVKSLTEDKLEITKLIGIGTDGASVMTGSHNSVFTKLKELQPDLILIPCICHSLHLACSAAVSFMPTELEYITNETYNWFSRSSKRYGHFSDNLFITQLWGHCQGGLLEGVTQDGSLTLSV